MEAMAQNPVPERPRILISTDVGGTDPVTPVYGASTDVQQCFLQQKWRNEIMEAGARDRVG